MNDASMLVDNQPLDVDAYLGYSPKACCALGSVAYVLDF